MPKDNENLEIEIEGEATETPEVEIVEEKPVTAKTEAIEPEEGINDLKQKLENERQMRIQAEYRAQEATQRHYEARNEVEDTNLQLVRSAIDMVKGENKALKDKYSEALTVGDHALAAEIQEAMSLNAARLMELNRGKEYLENKPKEPPPRAAPPSDPVEALASQLSPRSAAWVRAHPQCATDPRMYSKMIAAHNLALADGIEPDSDDYFGAIEDTLKIGRRVQVNDLDDPMSGAAKAVKTRTAPPAAPVSRSGSTPSTRPNVVRLSREEADTARDLGMTPEEYARNKALLQKEGRM